MNVNTWCVSPYSAVVLSINDEQLKQHFVKPHDSNDKFLFEARNVFCDFILSKVIRGIPDCVWVTLLHNF